MSLVEEVIGVVCAVVKVPVQDLTEDSGLGTIAAWDSLKHTILVLELENAFDVAFDFDELDHIVTVKAIVESLEAKGVHR